MSEVRVEYVAGRGCLDREPHWKVLQGLMSEQQSALRRCLKSNVDGDGVLVRVYRHRVCALHEAIRALRRGW